MLKVFLSLLLSSALFANIATVVDKVGSATLQRGGKEVPLKIKTALKEHDVIKTGSRSKVKIFFRDNTAVSLGQNTTFSIDAYLYDGTKKSTVKFGVVKGFFKTVTGGIGRVAPSRFKLKTKNATIGIRGTVFAAIVDNKEDDIICTDGVIEVKNPFGVKRVEAGKEALFYSSKRPKVKKYTQTQKMAIIAKTGWSGSKNIQELIRFIKENFKEPLRSQLLATIENILNKDSDSRREYLNLKKRDVKVEDAGFVDDIHINGRELDTLNERVIEFYKDDLINGKVIVDGILESEDETIPLQELYVEISVDGGENWQRATGHSEWKWSFTPELEKEYAFALRVVREHKRSLSGFAKREKNQQGDKLAQELTTYKTKQMKDYKDGALNGVDIKVDVDGVSAREDGVFSGGLDIPGFDKGDSSAGGIEDSLDIRKIGEFDGIGGAGDRVGDKIGDGSRSYDGRGDPCSMISYYQHSGNGDIVGRHGNMAALAEACMKKQKEDGFDGSDYYNRTATNSPVTSSPLLKDGEVLGHNSDSDEEESSDDDSSSDSEDSSSENMSTDSSDDSEDDASNNMSVDTGCDSSNASCIDDDDDSGDDEESSDESYENGGDSPDPVDNESGPVHMTAKQKAATEKVMNRNTKGSISYVGAKSGGAGDGRVDKDDDSGGGMVLIGGGQDTPEDSDDGREPLHTSTASGKLKTTVKEQLGGNINVKDR